MISMDGALPVAATNICVWLTSSLALSISFDILSSSKLRAASWAFCAATSTFDLDNAKRRAFIVSLLCS